jgi:Txe/YoeB family toxin of Txe-Axe toxin-antitoxin module
MAALKFMQTSKFARSYSRYNGERARVRQKIAELITKHQADPVGWLRNLERLRDPQLEIYRIKVTEGDRLIFSVDSNKIIFLDVGPHEVMEDFLSLSASAKNKIIDSLLELPKWFFKSRSSSSLKSNLTLADEGGEEMRWIFEDELNESWLQFLDEEQSKVRDKIFEQIKTPGEFEFHLILGGAGTGKTVILLNIALSLKEEGRNVVTRFSEQVLKYLNSGVQRVPGSKLELQPGSVVLLDDPRDLTDLRKMLQECARVGVRALVVTLDPFQWIERRVYEKFYDLIDSLEPKLHELSLCYRQSANVGSKALQFTDQILEKTSPFILDAKIEAHRKSLDPLREICVENVRFVDDGGRFRIYEKDLAVSFLTEVTRIRSRIDLWRHWHPLLLVEDSVGFPLPREWKSQLKGLNSVTKPIEASQQVRGCEYQEVFLLLGARTWDMISNGILGATSSDWQRAISFHTLMTRPKDSLVLFIKS